MNKLEPQLKYFLELMFSWIILALIAYFGWVRKEIKQSKIDNDDKTG